MQRIINDIIQWDVRSWQRALAFWETQINTSTTETCLELGGREGGLSLWLAQAGKRVVCSDLENTAATARPLHEKHKVQSLIVYEDIDATAIPYENEFDIIVFKSIVGGVGRNSDMDKQKAMFRSIHRALKPNGQLFFAENLVGSPLHRLARRYFSAAHGNAWRYITVAEIHDFLSPFTTKTIHTTGFLATFGRTETQRNALAQLDECFFNWLVPKHWQYIVYGVATK